MSLRLISFIILLGTMTISSVYAQDSGTNCCQCNSIYIPEYLEGSSGYSGEEPSKLFDSKPETKWCCSYSSNNKPYVTFGFEQAVKINLYTLTTADDTESYPERNWKSWTLYGGTKENGIYNWDETPIHAITDAGLPKTNGATATFNVGSQIAYQYYKLVVEEIESYNDQQMADINFYFIDNGICNNCGSFQQPELNDNNTPSDETDDYYEIANAGNLYWFAALVNGTLTGVSQNTSANAKLTADITVNEDVLVEGNLNSNHDSFKQWTPIGNSSSKYSGAFDGDNHTISGLYYNNSSNNYVGLFGYVLNNTIQNVGIKDSYFLGNRNVGAIAGSLYGENGKVLNSYNKGQVYSSFSGQYQQAPEVGGLVGSAVDYAEISNCYNEGKVYSNGGVSVGGIVGITASDARVSNSYNTGFVWNNGYYGAVVGYFRTSSVSNCYYLEGTAESGGGFNAYEVYDPTICKTSAQFASGEVAWSLQNAQTSQETIVWGQNIDNEASEQNRQNYPVLNGAMVYKVSSTCSSEVTTYSNIDQNVAHVYVNGICACGTYQPATPVDGVYQIANAGNLYWFAALVNGNKTIIGEDAQAQPSANAKLTANITVNENVLVEGNLNSNHGSFKQWTPIGNYDSNYKGSFDGQGHTISGLYYNNSESEYVGLFGYTSSCSINNLGVIDSYFNAKGYVGGIAGLLSYTGETRGSVTNCYNTGAISGGNNTGAIVGYNAGNVTNCYNSGSIIGTQNTGAVVGCNVVEYGSVTNCYYLKEEGNSGIYGIGGTDSDGTHTVAKTNAQFASGEVAYLLQSSQTTQVWGQNIDNGQEVQFYPVLGDAKIYITCNNTYSNIPADADDHVFDNGFCICGAYEPATYNESEQYYEIANAGNLYWFAAMVNGDEEKIGITPDPSYSNVVLVNDIVVNQNVLQENGQLNGDGSNFRSWTPIGWYEGIYGTGGGYFGNFDGQRHTISGLYYSDDDDNKGVGLFGFIDLNNNGLFVENVGVVDSYFNAYSYVGGIVGVVRGYIHLRNCYNTGTVIGNSASGGIVGQHVRSNNNGSISIYNCYNYGLILPQSIYSNSVGGIIGRYSGNLSIGNSYYLKEENGINSGIYGIGGTDSDGTHTVAKTNAQFASGEVAYLLQEVQTDDQLWGQNIDNGEERQDRPVLGDARVYGIVDGAETRYTNFMGEDILWTYEDGVLIINGSGPIRDFAFNEAKPWSNYWSEIDTIIVKAGITRIGDHAFCETKDNVKIFLYSQEAPTIGYRGIEFATIYIPDLSGWDDFAVTSYAVNRMPTYTQSTDNGQRTIGWVGLEEGLTEPSSDDCVVINADMTIADGQSLSVNSFGFTQNGSLTIEDGGQLTCSLANGEVTVEKNITGNASTPGWYTISSPLKGNVAATSTSITGLIPDDANTYAFYRYDEPSFTWENYKHQANNFTTLDAGRGYLYANANANGTTLSFTGEINTESVEYKLTANGTTLSGFHLVGNPFTHNITFDKLSVPTGVELAAGYYVLSNQGAWAADPSTGDIKPGQGILIKTDDACTLTISPNATTNVGKGQEPRAKSQQPMLSLNVSNGKYSDRAFVIFGKGIGLDKINHQNEEIPVLYIPMSDADYAIAMMDESVNEIPVGFESSSMGEFTISLRQENCEFKELYLLDKETGAKVNILEEDYTFMATSGDNPDRFILVKSQGSQPEAQSKFAYISNNDIVIYDVEGNAQIDIYDVLGRRVYNTTGRDDVHIVSTDGYSAGVYVIRLMDENGLRTQKVIIE